MLKNKRIRNQKGHSLVELICAIVILAFVVLGMVKLFGNLSVHQVHASYRDTTSFLANELMEEIITYRFDELTAKDTSGNWSAIGLETGEIAGSKGTFDDVDDFHGLNEALTSPFVGFSRTVEVLYVADGALDTAATSDNDNKRVKVQVFNGGQKYAELITVIGAAYS